jgi:DNA polymerase
VPTDFNLLFLDFETYYDNEYSLRKMPTPNYILDPRFECQMVAVEHFGVGAQIIDGKDFPHYLKQFDPRKTTTVTFNALFDNSILAWRYGFVPVRMLDSMGMARALLGHKLVRFSLGAVAEALGLGAKGGALVKVLGMRAAEIKSRGLWDEFSAYALQDNVLNRDIFLKLLPHFPVSERRLMDLTLRCAIEPKFRMDIDLLTQHLTDVRGAKAELLAGSGVELSQLMSTQKFKEALERLGVTVETKTSPNTGRETPAFAKTDEFMANLLEHENPEVQALAAARLGFKSTLEETRCEKLLSVASLPWDFLNGPTMPIPLRYGGAHTHRLSGEWGMNMQNLPTARGSKGKSKLRLGLTVPEGYSVVTADLGQIGWLPGYVCAQICSSSSATSWTPTRLWVDRYSVTRWTPRCISWSGSSAKPRSWG